MGLLQKLSPIPLRIVVESVSVESTKFRGIDRPVHITNSVANGEMNGLGKRIEYWKKANEARLRSRPKYWPEEDRITVDVTEKFVTYHLLRWTWKMGPKVYLSPSSNGAKERYS